MSDGLSLHETRVFDLGQDAYRKKQIDAWYHLANENTETYWREAARTLFWNQAPTVGIGGKAPHETWFADGKINAAENCLDVHLQKRPDQIALDWEGEPEGESATLTYRELHARVCAFAQGLFELNLRPGDPVAIYMPLVPEAVVAMLACARMGLPHNVIFAGFSQEAVKERINDSKAKAVITADFGYRKGQRIELRSPVAAIADQCSTLVHKISLARAAIGKDSSSSGANKISDWLDFHSLYKNPTAREVIQPPGFFAEHPLFFLYTSGSTGKPKGLVHATGGYLTGVRRSQEIIFGDATHPLPPVYWCTADIGWITGHSYTVYGPLMLGYTVFIYEGAPFTPDPGRFWRMIERHKITHFYTAPTAIRSFMKLGAEIPAKYDLSSLKILGTVGEPINPEAWLWYFETIGQKKCPIADTYWQTETGSIIASSIAHYHSMRPGSAGFFLPGYSPKVVGQDLCLTQPWPSRARTILGDNARFVQTYFSKHNLNNDFKTYFTGDGATFDAEDYFWCLGRVDDVLNVSGHRIGTMEVESALVMHPAVSEAAVIGKPDPIKGESILAFVTLKSSHAHLSAEGTESDALKKALALTVVQNIGALARPDEIKFMDPLPKTRSGKIMRRLLKEIAIHGKILGDTSTLTTD